MRIDSLSPVCYHTFKGDGELAQTLIRDIDPIVMEKLKLRASRNRRSVESELRLIIELAVSEPVIDPLAEVIWIRELFAGSNFDDSSELIREARQR